MVFTLFGLLTRRASHDGCRGKLSFLYPSNKLLLQFSWTQFPVNHNKWPSKRPTLTRDAIQYETKCDFSTSPHNIQNKRFWQFVQKFFGHANRLLQQLSGWLVSDDLGGEDAGCAGPGLRLWGRLDTAKFSETPLETAYGREMNIQFTGNRSGGHSCSLHANCMLPQNLRHLWHCAVIKLHILEWPFIVASLRYTCAIIMLSNQHLDMPHLWGGWIISAKEKCSLRQIYTDLWTIFERNRPFVYIEKVSDLWVQLMKNGGKNKSVAFIILFSVKCPTNFKNL